MRSMRCRFGGMRLTGLAGVILVSATILSQLASGPARAAGLGLEGRVAVNRLEMAFLPEDGLLKVRVHLVNGIAVEYESSSEPVIRSLLQIAEAGRGGGRLYVELQKGRIRSFQLDMAYGPS